ncbi:hypothetical protein EIP91_009912 [Steccherinum ochraceum]|uniref:Cytochrome P450 n=1 Tax=Steccherinum ochraceum TaxID=92696 RepID=A0A4R0RMC9_9APHY|nr:hypothetical protein EIP91_009912 [Steccherinum ochraceum]
MDNTRTKHTYAASYSKALLADEVLPAVALASLVVIVLELIIWSLKRGTKKFPPGPPRHVLRDHSHLIPTEEPWKKFHEWHQHYGPVISFKIGSGLVISLGTVKAAYELLDKRSDIYSGRPRSIVGGEILSGMNRGAFQQGHSKRFKNWRSLMTAGMNPTAAQQYRPLQDLESTILIRDLLREPDKYKDFMARYAMSVAFSIGYGRRIKSLDSDVVLGNKDAESFLGRMCLPGQYAVESWPSLLWLPKSVQWFRWTAERQRKRDEKFYMSLMRQVEKQIADGTAMPSMALNALSKVDQLDMTPIQTAYALSSPWAGGVDTTTVALEIVLMALLLHPDVVKHCQAEVDDVTGRSRLPTFSDESRLPYLKAVIKEAHRWHPEAPLAFAHANSQDDVYEGMFIPKGTTIYGNVYTICRDPDTFPDPDHFRPERFLETTDPRLVNFTRLFGFGRRICPGQHIAMASQLIVLAKSHASFFLLYPYSSLLATFNICPVKDENGKPILPDPTVGSTGLAWKPLPYPLALVSRNADIVDVAMREAENADEQLKGWLWAD